MTSRISGVITYNYPITVSIGSGKDDPSPRTLFKDEGEPGVYLGSDKTYSLSTHFSGNETIIIRETPKPAST